MSSLNSGTHLFIHKSILHTDTLLSGIWIFCLAHQLLFCSDFPDSISWPLPTAKTWSFVCFHPFCTQNLCLIQAFLPLIFSVWSAFTLFFPSHYSDLVSNIFSSQSASPINRLKMIPRMHHITSLSPNQSCMLHCTSHSPKCSLQIFPHPWRERHQRMSQLYCSAGHSNT